MSETIPVVDLARHGETARTITGQHTGLFDLRSPSGRGDGARAW
jgi:hypothetical protein